MKNYTKKIESPRLVIENDGDTESPRHDDNLGYFVTVQRNKISPDGDKFTEIYGIVKETADEVSSTQGHMDLISARVRDQIGENIQAIYPVYCYEHGSVSYKLGTAQGFDVSNCGFYIITDRTQKVTGTSAADFEKVAAAELELYTKWANGEIYRFELFDQDGESADSCGGFYDIEDIRESLPEEWKDEDLRAYLK